MEFVHINIKKDGILLQGATLELRQSDGELEVRASQVRSVRLVECDTFSSAGNI